MNSICSFDVLEAILIHGLSLVFNSLQDFPVVRAFIVVEQLDSSVRLQAALLNSRKRAPGTTSNEARRFRKWSPQAGKAKVKME